MTGKRLLLVDDDPKNIKILRESFSLAEFDVDFAPTDAEAYTKIELNPPDVIITELSPPRIDGYRLLEQVERNPKTAEVPVIFLTKKSDVWNRVKSFKLGAKDYIVKPLHVKEIVARINMVLNRLEKRKMQEAEEKRKHTGRLEDLSIIDLIESLGVKRKSGVVTLTNENGKSGQIFFNEGAIVNATCGNLVAEDAFYQMVPWRKGRFSIIFKQVDVQDEISVSNLGLLMQAAKRIEQREKILALLPSSNCTFVISDTFKKIITKKQVNPDLEKFVNLFNGMNDISRIIDESEYDDLSTLERINKLFKLGFLEIKGNGEPSRADLSKQVMGEDDTESERFSQDALLSKITVKPSEKPVLIKPEEPYSYEAELEIPGNQDLEIPADQVQTTLSEENLPSDTNLQEDYLDSKPLSSEIDFKEENPGLDVPGIREDLDLLNEKVTEESILQGDLFVEQEITEPVKSEPPEEDQNVSSDRELEFSFKSQEPEAAETIFAEQIPPTEARDEAVEQALDAENAIPTESLTDELSAEKQDESIQKRIETLEKNYPFDLFENAQPVVDDTDTIIPDVALADDHRTAAKPTEPLESKRIEQAKRYGLGINKNRDESLNQLIREVIPEKQATVPKPDLPPVNDRPVAEPVILEPGKKVIPPRAEQMQKDQPEKSNILVITNENNIRSEMIRSLVGGDYIVHNVGGTQLTDIYMGVVQFKGGHSLNVLGIATDREFKPVVDYLSSRILGYILLIDSASITNYNYLGYLINTLNNKLNLPSLVLIRWDAKQGPWNEQVMRAKLGLVEGNKVESISEINPRTARRAIFSLFGVSQSIEA